jgi:methylglutamate dehydrogenase subunit D
MPERASPLVQDASAPGLSLGACGLLIQYHGWPETYAELAARIAAQCGAATAPAPSKAVHGAGGSLLRIHPQRLWFLSERSDAAGNPAIDLQLGAALDLSNARAIIRVADDVAGALLSRFVAIDLRPHRFAIDDVATTPLHRVSVVLWRRSQGIDILVPRSFARSIWDLLAETAERLR